MYRIAQSRQNTGWTADSISPGVLSVPKAFINPDEVVKQAKAAPSAASQVKPITVEDFMTEPVQLNDPKLGSRKISSIPYGAGAPQKAASISAYGNFQAPAFLTEAVNRLNSQQSSAARMQDEYRQQLLDAVLSGNYLAAEALRASSVAPGASVAFGQQVADPNVGLGYAQQATAAAQESQQRTQALQSVTNEQMQLQQRLQDVTKQLASMPSGTGLMNPLGGSNQQGQLQIEQFSIKRELDRQRQLLAQGGGYRPSGYATTPVALPGVVMR